MNKYIISVFTYRCAERTAKRMELNADDWFYVSLRIPTKREEKLSGIKTDKDKLIGYFTNEEINELTVMEG